MGFVVALSLSVGLSWFWVLAFYEMRQARYEDHDRAYNPWMDYVYVYSCVATCAATAVGISSKIGV